MGNPQFGRRLALVTVGTALIAAVVYLPALGAYFRDDDFAWLQAAREWTADTRPLTQGDAGATPLYNLLYFTLYRSAGLNPLPYFLSLLIAHALCTALVALLIGRLTRSALAAGCGALLFAVLFSHQEAVAWPAGGLHVFAAVPLLAAVLLWLEYRRGRAWALPLSVFAATAAVFTKDTAVVVLPALLSVELLGPRRPQEQPPAGARMLAWHLVPYALLGGWRVLLPPLHEPISLGGGDYRFGTHLLTNLLLVPPQMLLPDLRFENYAQMLARVLPPAAGAVTALALPMLLAMSGGALWLLAAGVGSRMSLPSARTSLPEAQAATRATVRAAVAWCYLGFLPVLPFSYTYARAPRYGYLPSIGLALLVGVVVQWAVARRGAWRPLALVVLAAYLFVSVALLQLAQANRLRDSAVRRQVLATLSSELPAPRPRQVIALQGLPKQFADLTMAVPLLYRVPVEVRVGEGRVAAGETVFSYGADGRLRSDDADVGGAAPASP